MGTGKTVLVHRWISAYFKNANIIYISIRKTFTQDTYSKFKSLGFASYEDINTPQIDSKLFPKLIIQIDSVHRIPKFQLQNYDLIIFDEIESILTHCASDDFNGDKYKLKNFINLCKTRT